MMDLRIFGTLARAAAIAILASTACSRSGEGPEKKGPRVEPGALPRTALPEPPSAPPKPALRLKVYPDMAVPGKEVVLEAEVMPGDLSGTRRVTFVAVSDLFRNWNFAPMESDEFKTFQAQIEEFVSTGGGVAEQESKAASAT